MGSLLSLCHKMADLMQRAYMYTFRPLSWSLDSRRCKRVIWISRPATLLTAAWLGLAGTLVYTMCVLVFSGEGGQQPRRYPAYQP